MKCKFFLIAKLNTREILYLKGYHPPNILKQIPISILTRLSNLSWNEEIFNQSTPYYEKTLKRSGYNHTFEYRPTMNNHCPKNRKRNIVWFNPPFNANLSTNISKCFLNMLKKYVPRQIQQNLQ